MKDDVPETVSKRPALPSGWNTFADMVTDINDGDERAMNALIEEWKAYKRAQHENEPEA
ncbi:hypothetical protein HNQ77_004807 [Silvibacterium bohemicum]|uniref:Uncharacterized protein n=1 Tax=Silvibacterium bohemicum TaxID=1577686 RepID=A0A841JZS4_9BACT|nr:hypothetical protein [Silvibacterium bohemicum]MBB6146826.1 hypothetical protein [Silvibacterium bohemicum]